jgi:carbonic anhydrase
MGAHRPTWVRIPPSPPSSRYSSRKTLLHTLPNLFQNNREWARRISERDPAFFRSLVAQQSPKYLWIGCSDSRVPANEIVGLLPGELFVHRNVANVVVHTDLNCLSVLQYAVDVLQVEHVIVCGHYACGGVQAAYARSSLGLIDNWLRHVQDVRDQHETAISRVAADAARVDRLCELNVIEQVRHVCHTTIVQDAWRRRQQLTVHGWIYALHDGLLRDLRCAAGDLHEVDAAYAQAVESLTQRA